MLERMAIREVGRASALGERTKAEAGGLTISERSGIAVIELATFARGDAGRQTLSRALGLALPAAGRATEASGISALSIGPGRWLLIGAETAITGLPTPSEEDAAVTDLSGGRTILTLAGRSAVRTLAKGTAVDLDPAIFAPGTVAATALARIPVVIWRRGDVYDVIVPRSYAVSLVDWLIGAAGAS